MLTERLKKIEEELAEYENIANPVQVAWAKSCNMLNITTNTALFQLGEHLAKLSWFKKESPTAKNHNPYHNQVHTAQVMHSGAVLWNEELESNPILTKSGAKKIAPYFLIALMFHDFKHPGRVNNSPFELEQMSIDAFRDYVIFDKNFYDVWEDTLEFEIDESLADIMSIVSSLICATEVSEATKYHQKSYLEAKEQGEINFWAVAHLLMSEADLLASVLPNLGRENGQKLADELNNPVIAKPTSRIGFLKSVNYVSYAAQKLEIPQMIEADIVELLK